MLKRREEEAFICRKHRATSAWRPWAKSHLLTPYTFFPCLGSGLLKARILFHQEIKQGSFCYGVSQRHWPVLIHPSIHPFMYPPIHLPMYLSILMHISLIQRAFIEYLLCQIPHWETQEKVKCSMIFSSQFTGEEEAYQWCNVLRTNRGMCQRVEVTEKPNIGTLKENQKMIHRCRDGWDVIIDSYCPVFVFVSSVGICSLPALANKLTQLGSYSRDFVTSAFSIKHYDMYIWHPITHMPIEHIYIYTCAYIYIFTHIHIYTYTCTHIDSYIHICWIYTYISLYVSLYSYRYTCIYQLSNR